MDGEFIHLNGLIYKDKKHSLDIIGNLNKEFKILKMIMKQLNNISVLQQLIYLITFNKETIQNGLFMFK